MRRDTLPNTSSVTPSRVTPQKPRSPSAGAYTVKEVAAIRTASAQSGEEVARAVLKLKGNTSQAQAQAVVNEVNMFMTELDQQVNRIITGLLEKDKASRCAQGKGKEPAGAAGGPSRSEETIKIQPLIGKGVPGGGNFRSWAASKPSIPVLISEAKPASASPSNNPRGGNVRPVAIHPSPPLTPERPASWSTNPNSGRTHQRLRFEGGNMGDTDVGAEADVSGWEESSAGSGQGFGIEQATERGRKAHSSGAYDVDGDSD